LLLAKQSLDEAPYINCPKLSQASKHHLQSFVSPFQERLNLGFLTEGKLAAILITHSSWGSQRADYSPRTRTACYTSTWHQQLLSLPIPVGNDYPIIQYADDTIIVLPADSDQLSVFKGLLDQYAAFTVLKVNYQKSSMIPINLSQDEAIGLT
jgi:hypothetical protein